MEGSVLSFLKAEWKVSDTGSAHWDSSILFYVKICICLICEIIYWNRGSYDHMVIGFTTTCAISANPTKVVSSNPVHGKVYSIQHYVIKFVSDLRQVSGFLWVLKFWLVYLLKIILFQNYKSCGRKSWQKLDQQNN